MKKLLATRKGSLIYVQIENEPKICGKGITIDEAIGEMIRHHLEEFDLTIEWQKQKYHK